MTFNGRRRMISVGAARLDHQHFRPISRVNERESRPEMHISSDWFRVYGSSPSEVATNDRRHLIPATTCQVAGRRAGGGFPPSISPFVRHGPTLKHSRRRKYHATKLLRTIVDDCRGNWTMRHLISDYPVIYCRDALLRPLEINIGRFNPYTRYKLCQIKKLRWSQ